MKTTGSPGKSAPLLSDVGLQQALDEAHSARQNVASLQDARRRFRKQEQELLRRIEELRTRPVTPDDAKAFLFGRIDQLADMFSSNGKWTSAFARLAVPKRKYPHPDDPKPQQLSIHDIESFQQKTTISDLSWYLDGVIPEMIMAGQGETVSIYSLCFFFGDIIKAKIEQHFDRLFPAPKESFSMAESYVLIKQIEVDLEDTQSVLIKINTALSNLGVSVELS
ncbi:UNVERIFIED_ORG: hypothetical protein LHJ69_00455 [Shinella sp. XGS7]|nr:hypothetical protein [Shinella sp. XGS7]